MGQGGFNKIMAKAKAREYVGYNELDKIDEPKVVAEKMMRIYPGGITDLLRKEGQKDLCEIGEPHLILFLNCPNSFHKKFEKFDKFKQDIPGVT